MSKLSDWSEGIANVQQDRTNRLRGSSLWTRFVGWLNNELNPHHDWFDYASWDNNYKSIENQITRKGLTGAEQEANAFTASEAQKQRDWEEQMSNTAYQRQVKDMQAAGVNPAMAMSAGGASTPSGASASSVSPGASGLSFADIMQAILMPMQRKLMKAQAKMAADQGEAALITAKANAQNAGTNERNAATNEVNAETQKYEAETRRMLKDIEQKRVGIYESLSDEEKKNLAERTAFIKVQREQLPEQLRIAYSHADADQKRAIAALQSAEAAVQNAATNDRLADYETSLKYTQELLSWAEKEGKEIVNRYLDDRQRQELDNLRKEGVRLDAQGRLIDKTGHLITAQTVKTYVNVGTDISNAVNRWINPLSGMSSPSPSAFTMDNTVGAGLGTTIYGGM